MRKPPSLCIVAVGRFPSSSLTILPLCTINRWIRVQTHQLLSGDWTNMAAFLQKILGGGSTPAPVADDAGR